MQTDSAAQGLELQVPLLYITVGIYS